jgi:GxxExxY protein
MPRPIGHELTHAIIGGFYDVYNEFGYGLLEGVYAGALRYELELRGLSVERELWTDVFYKGVAVAKQRIDLLVSGGVIVEIKSTETLPPFAKRQLLNYLRVSGMELGLLLHFGPEPKVYRVINTVRRHWPRAGAGQLGRR